MMAQCMVAYSPIVELINRVCPERLKKLIGESLRQMDAKPEVKQSMLANQLPGAMTMRQMDIWNNDDRTEIVFKLFFQWRGGGHVAGLRGDWR